jgi:multiple antibiotic resistance protein
MMSMFHEDVFLKFLAALLALLNPLYGIPVFISLTEGFSPAERRKTALVSTATITVTALVSLLIGEEILGVFGIDIPSFRIAGGLIILGIALSMMNAEEPPPGDAKATADGKTRKSIAVVPLAIPLTIGPGAIATTIVFAHQLDDAGEIFTLVPVVLLVCALVGLGLFFAAPISRLLGSTVISIMTRIMAIILAAVAIEMIVVGVAGAINVHLPSIAPSAGG